MSDQPAIQLKELSPKHKTIAALVAQGVPRQIIAEHAQFTPEYITWLQRQPLFIDYIKDMSEAAGVQLEAMFTQSVGVIQEAMNNGTIDERLRGAKLQMEATGRIGKFQSQGNSPGGDDHLDHLATRLVDLLKRQRSLVNGETVEGQVLSREVPAAG